MQRVPSDRTRWVLPLRRSRAGTCRVVRRRSVVGSGHQGGHSGGRIHRREQRARVPSVGPAAPFRWRGQTREVGSPSLRTRPRVPGGDGRTRSCPRTPRGDARGRRLPRAWPWSRRNSPVVADAGKRTTVSPTRLPGTPGGEPIASRYPCLQRRVCRNHVVLDRCDIPPGPPWAGFRRGCGWWLSAVMRRLVGLLGGVLGCRCCGCSLAVVVGVAASVSWGARGRDGGFWFATGQRVVCAGEPRCGRRRCSPWDERRNDKTLGRSQRQRGRESATGLKGHLAPPRCCS